MGENRILDLDQVGCVRIYSETTGSVWEAKLWPKKAICNDDPRGHFNFVTIFVSLWERNSRKLDRKDWALTFLRFPLWWIVNFFCPGGHSGFHYFTVQVESEFHIILQHSGSATCNNKSLFRHGLSRSEMFKQKIQERETNWNSENRSPNARSGRLTTLTAPTIKNWKGFRASELQTRLRIALLHSLVSHKAWGRAAALEQRRHSKRWSRVIIPPGNPAIWLMACWMLKTNINSLTSLMKTGYPAQLWKLIAKGSSPLRCQQV